MSHYDITNTPKRLREGDTVAFDVRGAVLTYTVAKLKKNSEAGKVVLVQSGTARNRQIFDLLGLSGTDVLEFASQAFGYDATGNKWPRSHASDFAAQVRLVYALFGKIATAPELVADPTPVAAIVPVDMAAIMAKLNEIMDAINNI
jgi:hypothetical protein